MPTEGRIEGESLGGVGYREREEREGRGEDTGGRKEWVVAGERHPLYFCLQLYFKRLG